MTTPARTDRDAGLERASALGAVVRTIAATTPAHPMVVKELFGVEGLPRTASSLTDGKTPAAADSDPVAMMRAAGYTPVALTRTHEHAWGITTRSPDGTGACNPHDPSRIAGGSSGGSAVCVAVGAVDVALGSDTAGSIRVPAAFCGVLGIRPTFDAISLRGVQGLAPTLDAPGLLCAGVAAAAPAMRALGLPTGYDGSPRLGVIADPTLPVLRADLAAVIAAAIAALGNPPLLDTPPAAEIHRAFVAVQLRDALAYHRDVLGFWPGRAEEYGADVRGRLELAEASTPPADLDQTRATLREAWLAATEGVDALLMPVAACGPSTIATPDLVDVDGVPTPLRDLVIPFTAPASLFGLPAFSVPVGVDRDGLPVGLQLIGRPGGEAALLSVATMVEQVLSSVH